MNTPDRPDLGCRNLRWALALFDGLAEGGLCRVVISPGSRSTPLVLAAEQQPLIEPTPILDERSAAFFALGLAEASGRPVALVCTSGSALAHWFPAVIEASESGVPLLLLSADRPPELRGWGANQTIDQTRLFGTFVREFHDPGPPSAAPAAQKGIRALGLRAALVSRGPRPGPVHINLPFREPLVPTHPCGPDPESRRSTPQQLSGQGHADTWGSARACRVRIDPPHESLRRLRGGRGIICCGPMRCPEAEGLAIVECARRLGAPLLADPLSGLRYGSAPPVRVSRYDSLLRNPGLALELKPDWIIRFGGTPVSKTLASWSEGVPTLLVDTRERWSDPTHDVVARIHGDADTLLALLGDWDVETVGDPDHGWLARWMGAERWVEQVAHDFLTQARWCEGHLIGQLLTRLEDGDGLYCANSLPIRQLDTWSGQGERRLRLLGHRGASGIDGQTSTLAGLSRGWGQTARGITGLLGDLSFLHDLSGLALLETLDRPCIVLNNGGGRIFDGLAQRDLAGLERFWRTPQRVQIGALAAAFALRHRVVEDALGFDQAWDDAMAAAARGDSAGLIEVRLDADASLRTHQAFWNTLVRGSTADDAEPLDHV